MNHSDVVFQFCVGRQTSKGTIFIRIRSGSNFIQIQLDVVAANLPLLIVLDIIDKYKVTVYASVNMISNAQGSWWVPLQRGNGHLHYACTMSDVLYTRAQMSKFHNHFLYPTANKLYNLVERASPEDCTPDTRPLLVEIKNFCHLCRTFGTRSIGLQVSLPEANVVLNSELALYLFCLDGRATTHVVYLATCYSNSAFLLVEIVGDAWNSFVLCLFTGYPGYPNAVRVDQGGQFPPIRWEKGQPWRLYRY